MKIFVSLPHHERSEKDILQSQRDALAEIEKDENVEKDGALELIDTIHHLGAPANASRLWYLGESIKKLDEADLVYFAPNWWKAKGCWVEFIAAWAYDKNVVYEYPAGVGLFNIRAIFDLITELMTLTDNDDAPKEDKK